MKLNAILAALVAVTTFLAWGLPLLSKREAATEERAKLIYVDVTSQEDALRLAGQVNELTLTSFDPKAKEVVDFTIARKDDRWIIPSHHDYPADGGKKVGQAAGSVLALKLGREVTDDTADFADLGVVDPKDTEATEGHGLRIAMQYGSGKEICDLIVGKRPEEKWDHRYVRDAGDNRVYEAELKLDVKTDFTEWVERDLLKIDRDAITEVVVKNYRVVDKEMVIQGRPAMVRDLEDVEELVFTKGDDAKWSLAGEAPAGKVFDEQKVTDLIRAIDDIRISGVRPQLLAQTSRGKLEEYGIFIHPNTGQILGNEGVDHVVTKDGLEYRIYFGEEVAGEGRVLSAGILDGDEPAAEDGDAKDGDAEKDKTGAHRFAVVLVTYNPDKDEVLQGIAAEEAKAAADKEGDAKGDDAKGEEATGEDAKTGDAGTEAGKDKAAAKDGDKKPDPAADFKRRREERLKEMQEKHAEVSKRFMKWVYVISDDVFKRLRPDRAGFYKEPEPEKKDAGPGGSAPKGPIPGMPSIPGVSP